MVILIMRSIRTRGILMLWDMCGLEPRRMAPKMMNSKGGCLDWTTKNNGYKGYVGNKDKMNRDWTFKDDKACNYERRLNSFKHVPAISNFDNTSCDFN
jgi:hypothetical protein